MANNGNRVETWPLTAERWPDLEALFGERGAVGGCWCMWWRQTAAEFAAQAGEANRHALKALAEGDTAPGILAYVDDRPVGWCSVAPRSEFGRINRSPVLRAVDSEPVWSIVCFFIHRAARRQGVASTLLRAAIEHAGRQGARVVEAYPVATSGRASSGSIYTGTLAMFEAAGFREVARRSADRPIVRRDTGA